MRDLSARSNRSRAHRVRDLSVRSIRSRAHLVRRVGVGVGVGSLRRQLLRIDFTHERPNRELVAARDARHGAHVRRRGRACLLRGRRSEVRAAMQQAGDDRLGGGQTPRDRPPAQAPLPCCAVLCCAEAPPLQQAERRRCREEEPAIERQSARHRAANGGPADRWSYKKSRVPHHQCPFLSMAGRFRVSLDPKP
jgi:hypothetical protein